MTGAYRWDPGDYAAHSSVQLKLAQELLAKLSPRGDERALDLGCGDGKVTALLAGMLPQGSVLGLDASQDMVEHASAAFPSGANPKLGFTHGDAAALEFGAEFDLVFSNACLHWIKDHRPVLAGIKRCLRPGGRMLLQMGGKGNAAEIVRHFDIVTQGPAWIAYYQGFDMPYGFHSDADYAAWLKEAGLHPTRVELLQKDTVHQSEDQLAGWIRTTWMPFLDPAPPETHDELVARVVQSYLDEHPPDDDGVISVRMVRLEVEAHA